MKNRYIDDLPLTVEVLVSVAVARLRNMRDRINDGTANKRIHTFAHYASMAGWRHVTGHRTILTMMPTSDVVDAIRADLPGIEVIGVWDAETGERLGPFNRALYRQVMPLVRQYSGDGPSSLITPANDVRGVFFRREVEPDLA